jgi:hypothetical protein
MLSYWPVVAGTHYKIGSFSNFYVVILIDQGLTSFIQTLVIGEINLSLLGKDRNNPELIRKEIFKLNAQTTKHALHHHPRQLSAQRARNAGD